MLHKYLLFIFFILILQVCHARAETPILERKINLALENETLEDILLIVSEQAGFSFSYNSEIIPVDSILSVDIQNSAVHQILVTLLGDEIDHKISGNHLILLKKPQKGTKSDRKTKFTITGYVFDESNGEGLDDVSIYEVNGLVSALSEFGGNYSISVPTKYEHLSFHISKRNYSDTIIIVSRENQEIRVGLKQVYYESFPTEVDDIDYKPYLYVDSLSLVKKFVPRNQVVQADNIEVSERRLAQVSVIPRIGTNLQMSGLVTNVFSLNILGGYAGGVNGVEIGGLFNIDKNDVKGFQVAGLSNAVGGSTGGVQFAGLVNYNRGDLKGVQVGGIYNQVVERLVGVQIAGINNTLRGEMIGWQIAGINNLTTKNVDGAQLGGISNIAYGDVKLLQVGGIYNHGRNVGGFQVSGIANYAQKEVGGLQLTGIANIAQNNNTGQIAGIANITRDRLKGIQLSAVVNYAKTVNGSQIGLINVADTVTGIPIGLVSIVNKGYHRFELSYNDVLYGSLSFKIGVRKFYNIFTGGYNWMNNAMGYGYGFGTESSMGRNGVFNFDATLTQIFEDTDDVAFNATARLNPSFGIQLWRRVALTAGPTVCLHISDLRDPDTNEFITDIAPYVIWEDVPSENTKFQFWIGWNAGIRF